VGVLVQTNFGGVLEINGAPVGVELSEMINPATGNKWPAYSNKGPIEDQWGQIGDVDGSCMIIVATDAPLDFRNLQRLSRRAFTGLGKTGSVYSNGSGDYIIAFSTVNRMPNTTPGVTGAMRGCISGDLVHNDAMTPLFQAAIEATEEAIINSLFKATDTVSGRTTRYALPIDETIKILQKYGRLESPDEPCQSCKDKDKCLLCQLREECKPKDSEGCNVGIGFAGLLMLLAMIVRVARRR
jgi:D-aminopeptidase